MQLTRWDPVRDLIQISNRLSRFATDDSGRFGGEDSYGSWVPPVDIFEKNETLVLRVELPGVEKDDIDIRVENGVLTLHGQRRREQEFDEKNAYRLERSYGAFSRSFSLPTIVDSSKIVATYRDGVLEVTLPKAEEAKPKRVPIQAT
jgi:HSP20 family protein